MAHSYLLGVTFALSSAVVYIWLVTKTSSDVRNMSQNVVLLACVLLKEKISRMQWGGVILCVVAIALIIL